MQCKYGTQLKCMVELHTQAQMIAQLLRLDLLLHGLSSV